MGVMTLTIDSESYTSYTIPSGWTNISIIHYIVVAGGGGGGGGVPFVFAAGGGAGGGGHGGGSAANVSRALSVGNTITFTAGAGGSAGAAGMSATNGGNGGNSTIAINGSNVYTATGGGGGEAGGAMTGEAGEGGSGKANINVSGSDGQTGAAGGLGGAGGTGDYLGEGTFGDGGTGGDSAIVSGGTSTPGIAGIRGYCQVTIQYTSPNATVQSPAMGISSAFVAPKLGWAWNIPAANITNVRIPPPTLGIPAGTVLIRASAITSSTAMVKPSFSFSLTSPIMLENLVGVSPQMHADVCFNLSPIRISAILEAPFYGKSRKKVEARKALLLNNLPPAVLQTFKTLLNGGIGVENLSPDVKNSFNIWYIASDDILAESLEQKSLAADTTADIKKFRVLYPGYFRITGEVTGSITVSAAGASTGLINAGASWSSFTLNTLYPLSAAQELVISGTTPTGQTGAIRNVRLKGTIGDIPENKFYPTLN